MLAVPHNIEVSSWKQSHAGGSKSDVSKPDLFDQAHSNDQSLAREAAGSTFSPFIEQASGPNSSGPNLEVSSPTGTNSNCAYPIGLNEERAGLVKPSVEKILVEPSFDKIRLLDLHTVNQISAGEVVERPASVVKELVENSIDAGAKQISIELVDAGKAMIRIRDDGCGMSLSEARMSLQRHATSKIRSVDDLDSVVTLGFRGEALPSIASVSRFTLSTADSAAAVLGTRVKLRVDGGAVKEHETVAGPRGTEIEVLDLFFNTPARLKFLKSTTTEVGACMDVVSRFAIAHPEISFHFTHNRQEVLRTLGDGDRLAAIGSVWSRDVARTLAEVDVEIAGIHLTGYCSPPHVTKSNRSYQYVYVNGRSVRTRTLTAALDQAYRDITPERRFAMLALDLSIDPARIDVNVSPTKSEVKFQHEGAAFEALKLGIRGALMEHGMMPTFQGIAAANEALSEASKYGSAGFGTVHNLTIFEPRGGQYLPSSGAVSHDFAASAQSPPAYWPTAETRNLDGTRISENDTESNGEAAAGIAFQSAAENSALAVKDSALVVENFASDVEKSVGFGLTGWSSEEAEARFQAADRVGNPMENIASMAESIPAISGELPDAPLDTHRYPFADLLEDLRIIGQAMNTFIVAETRRGLIIVDQHVAHERILYEYLCGLKGQHAVEKQPLLIPQNIQFDRRAQLMLGERLDEIKRLGFDLEPFGGDSYLLRAVPAALRGKDPIRMLIDLVDELVDSAVNRRLVPTREQIWIMSSCKMAVKAGDPLSLPEMEKLILDLATTENPYLCPHGRPITVTLDASSLLRLFKRT